MPTNKSALQLVLEYAKKDTATDEEKRIIHEIKLLNTQLEISDSKLEQIDKRIKDLKESDSLNGELDQLKEEEHKELNRNNDISHKFTDLFFSERIMHIYENELKEYKLEENQKRLKEHINQSKKRSLFSRFFNKNYCKEKISFLRTIIEEIISENENNNYLSCKSDILSVFDNTMKGKESQASNWDEKFDYEYNAYKFIYNCSFDLLCSGKYHIYAGVLNPLSPAPNLKILCKECLDYYVTNDLATEEEKKEQLRYLKERINQL